MIPARGPQTEFKVALVASEVRKGNLFLHFYAGWGHLGLSLATSKSGFSDISGSWDYLGLPLGLPGTTTGNRQIWILR